MIDPLFRLQFFHDYYVSGRLEDFRLVPDAPTARLIDRYRLLARMQDGVYSLNTTAAQGAAHGVRYLLGQDEDARLDFHLLCDLEHFSFITEMAPGWLGQLTLSSRTARADGADLRLAAHTGADGVIRPAVLAVVSIYLADVLLMGGEGVSYVFHFQARKLLWDYCVINRSRVKLADPAIGNQDGVAFQGPQAVVLASGERGLRFHSGTDAFPLQQVPSFMVDLVDRVAVSNQSASQPVEHCLIKGLPTPSLQQLTPGRAAGSAAMSCTMHVYL